ncbi:MAG: RagB/SusD family nutrient uptake outer membrane protein [Prevotella sp.]|nr:RagB/SusD family nutrient uptake outer membrane protein [Candidatus Prevotella equi]
MIFIFVAGLLASCQGFMDVDSTYYIDADKEHLNKANDSIYSVVGILNKVQAIADRTVLLGEARGDLVDVTATTSKDLRDVAMFSIGDDNMYNNPVDYYAIINNCNYFLAKVDTAMTNNRNENIFLNEFALVKAIRAWTYLQLVINYGEVPFYTEPLLTAQQAALDYPRKDILGICEYFLNEDGLQALADNEDVKYPYYGDIKGMPSRLFYFPMNIILGELSLWKATMTKQKADYLQAAKYYYKYITRRNGISASSSYPTTSIASAWKNTDWTSRDGNSYLNSFSDYSNTSSSEVISIIPMDSIQSEGYYSSLRGIYCGSYDNDYHSQLVPSQSLIDLSANQDYCFFDYDAHVATIAPKNLGKYQDGDLRLKSIWYNGDAIIFSTNERITYNEIRKFYTKFGSINIYRRAQIYLRLAEALNRAGYPRYAFSILQSGVNNDVIDYNIAPYYGKADSTMIRETFPFSNEYYRANYVDSKTGGAHWIFTTAGGKNVSAANTIGIHSRGCGDSWINEYYQLPYNPQFVGQDPYIDTPEQIEWQMDQVEDLIVNEQALEQAFEGTRFYDLMRVALRRGDPSYLANKINARCGKGNTAGIKTDLTNPHNWFLKWNNQIGYND